MAQDHYAVLGLGRDASTEDVKKAFRRIAAESHPDRNPGDEAAVRRFKAANEAFQVLSDDSKRAEYDLTTAPRPAPSPFHGMPRTQVEDYVRDMFSSFGGRPGRVRHEVHVQPDFPGRGDDIIMEVVLALHEAVHGCRKAVHVRGSRPTSRCGACSGTGAEPGARRIPCQACAGAGKSVQFHTGVPKAVACPACRGAGFIPLVHCRSCRGQGKVVHEGDVTVTIPAGVDTGQRLRLAGQGAPGSPPGDLFLDVRVERHESFGRKGPDLFTQVDLPLRTALRGGSVAVRMMDGSDHELQVPPMTQSGTILTVRGSGVRSPLAGTCGDLHVQVHVKFPPKLSPRAQKLLEELAEELG